MELKMRTANDELIELINHGSKGTIFDAKMKKFLVLKAAGEDYVNAVGKDTFKGKFVINVDSNIVSWVPSEGLKASFLLKKSEKDRSSASKIFSRLLNVRFFSPRST